MIKEKLLSGRYFATIAIITTYCVCIIVSIFMVANKTISVETFLGIFSAFSATAGAVINGYFNKDRKNEQ